jgi:hypothetical protein
VDKHALFFFIFKEFAQKRGLALQLSAVTAESGQILLPKSAFVSCRGRQL